MQVGLLLLAATSCFAADLTQDEIISNVLFSWQNNVPQEGEHWQHKEQEFNVEHHGRSKRAANPFLEAAGVLQPNRFCSQPGYTGEFCEYPICMEQNPYIMDSPDPENEGVNIDSAYLGDNCTVEYVTVIDDTLFDISVTISAAAEIAPNFNLVDGNGKKWFIDEVVVRTRSQFTGLYRKLPPNTYYLSPVPDLHIAACIMQIKAKTRTTIIGGFITGDSFATERSDYPDNQFTYQNTLNTFVVHGANLRYPGSLRAVSIFEGNAIVSRPQPLRPRFGCSYEYYYESFYCRNTGYYYYLVEGVTFLGFPFRRQAAFRCLNNPVVPTTVGPLTTSVPTNPTTCDNYGVLVNNADGSAYCMCRGLWSGPNCRQIVCMNGGFPIPDATRCICADGYDGNHCENVRCVDSGKSNFNVDEPTMVFVVRVGQQMDDVIAQVRTVIANITNTIEAWDPTYVNRFGVVFFRDQNIEHMGSYDSVSRLEAAFDKYAKYDVKSTNCSDIGFGALAVALQSIEVSPRSAVYVISDAMPNDYRDDLETVFALDSYYRVPLYFIYAEPKPGSGCNPSLDDPGFRAMDEITQRTMGLAFYVQDRNVQDLLYSHMYHTFYRSQLLLTNDVLNCQSQALYQSVSIDSLVNQIIVVAKSTQNITLYATSPDFKMLQFTQAYYGNGLQIWTANSAVVGNYMFNFLAETQESCSYRVYQKSYNSPSLKNQQYEMFWAFTPALNENGAFVQPVVGIETGIAVHLKNYPFEIPPDKVHAELLIYAQYEGKQEAIYMSNGIWRDGCDYQFYFPPFKCRTARENLHFQFYAKDALGFMIQRSGSMYCAEYHPTPKPPSDCQNGGVMSPDNFTCYCPPGFTGNKCEQIICLNGGSVNYNFCSCPPGFVGRHCEIASCFQKMPNPVVFQYMVDMIFAVEMTQNAQAQIIMLNKNFHETLRDVATQHPYWIRNIVLLGFNSTWGGVIAEAPASQADLVATALDNMAKAVFTDAGCTVDVWSAVGHAIRRRDIVPGSFLNVFMVSKPDNNDIRGIIATYEAARNFGVQITAVIGYNAYNGGSFYCNATMSDFQLLHDACRYSNGESYFLQQATVSDFTRIIPMKFMSGTVVHRRFADCTSQQYVAIPIDSYTQSIQITVEGYNAAVQVWNGRGNEMQYPDLQPLAIDTVSGLGFYNIRRACDPDWDKAGDWCLFFGYEKLSYNGARQVCYKAGGFLADDISSDKHDHLKQEGAGVAFWFGLNRVNSTGWYWDRPFNVSQYPLTNATAQYWDGGSPPTDPSKKCAYFSSTATWVGDDCSNARQFVCQKHGYTYDIEPHDIDDDDLPAGKWFMGIRTDKPDPAKTKLGTECFVEVKVQSHLQVLSAYSENIHSDWPVADPVSGSTNNHIISFVDSAGSYRDRDPILTHGLIFNAHNDTMYDAVTFQPRALCAFDWVSQNFACPDADNADNLFSVMHLGEDEFGYTFQRILNGHCSKPTITCGNGGLRYNGTCVCTEYWQGMYCMEPICQNGASYDDVQNQCVCPAGFAGSACQYETCTNPMNVTFSNNAKSLVLLIEETVQNRPVMNAIASKIQSIIDAANNQYPGWFSNYILATFNSQGIVFNQKFVTSSGISSAIISRISKISDTTICKMPLFTATGAVFANLNINPASPLLLFTSSTPNDSDLRLKTLEEISAISARVHNFYVPTDACQSGKHLPSDSDSLHFIRFAYATDGNNIFVNSSFIDVALQNYLPTLYQSNTLSHPTFHDNFVCPYGQYYITVDNNSTDIYITVSADMASLYVVDPQGHRVTADPIFSWEETKIYHVVKQYAGIYTMNLSSPTACYVNIAATNGPRVWNAFVQTSATDPTGAHTDNVTLTGTIGVPNVAVFHLAGTDHRHLGMLTYMSMFDPYAGNVIVSELHRRLNCHFEYYSDPFNCPTNSTEGFLMIVNGIDELGQNFRRQVTSLCIGNNPVIPGTTVGPVTITPSNSVSTTSSSITTTPSITPTTSYGHPNIKVDIVLLIDMTASAQSNFADYISFIKVLLAPLTISQDKARIAIVPVYPTANEAFVVAPLSAINNKDLLFSYLNTLSMYASFSGTGQYLGESLNLIKSALTTQDSGYRSDVKNHVIVYLTSNTAFSDDAKTAAQAILSSGNYGIIGIAYPSTNPTTDRVNLQTITGGFTCSYVPKDNNALNKQVLTNIQEIIFDNDMSGKYCAN